MDNKTALELCKLNNSFYCNNASSFSETRNAPWDGWKRCLDSARKVLEKTQRLSSSGVTEGEGLSIFDLACGNLRFESYLTARLPDACMHFYTVDNCSELAVDAGLNAPEVNHQQLDVLELLCQGKSINEQLDAPLCDLSACFGFMHHVPGVGYRKEVLLSLIQQTLPGGLVMISLWQFMKNEELREKALSTHERALGELGLPPLDQNDYLLGWQNLAGVYRYCHSFTDAEIDELVESVAEKVNVVARFAADGRTDNLNTYLVMQVL